MVFHTSPDGLSARALYCAINNRLGVMKNRNYAGSFEKWEDVIANFGGECPKKEPRFVFGQYETPSYEGYATVITSPDGKSFDVTEGSHCSCYGLEGQWEPTKHNVSEIRKMMGATVGFYQMNHAAIAEWLAHIRR